MTPIVFGYCELNSQSIRLANFANALAKGQKFIPIGLFLFVMIIEYPEVREIPSFYAKLQILPQGERVKGLKG